METVRELQVAVVVLHESVAGQIPLNIKQIFNVSNTKMIVSLTAKDVYLHLCLPVNHILVIKIPV